MTENPDSAQSGRGGLSTVAIVLIVLGAVVALLLVCGGVAASLAIYGTRKYVAEAKTAEGKTGVGQLANAVVACAHAETLGEELAAEPTPRAALPPSTQSVPAALGAVSGRKYMSSPQEWEAAGFTCIQFQMSSPQYFQYEWEQTSAASGVARARADLDGDGVAEVTLERGVDCTVSAGRLECVASPNLVEK